MRTVQHLLTSRMSQNAGMSSEGSSKLETIFCFLCSSHSFFLCCDFTFMTSEMLALLVHSPSRICCLPFPCIARLQKTPGVVCMLRQTFSLLAVLAECLGVHNFPSHAQQRRSTIERCVARFIQPPSQEASVFLNSDRVICDPTPTA